MVKSTLVAHINMQLLTYCCAVAQSCIVNCHVSSVRAGSQHGMGTSSLTAPSNGFVGAFAHVQEQLAKL